MIVPVSDEQLKAIRNTGPRSQAENDQDLAIIKHWLNKQPHLPNTSEYIRVLRFQLRSGSMTTVGGTVELNVRGPLTFYST